MFRCDTWTGGEHYFISFRNGTHHVMMATPDYKPENETIFTGTYEDCISKLANVVQGNYEYDMNI